MGTDTEGATMADAQARRSLKADLERLNLRVHQPDDPPLFTREPRPTMQPLHWRWSELVPALQRLGEQIAIGSGGQRRTLRLANPGLPYGTTPTMWASIQYILPGEVAEAHRHTANAFRFIIQGHGCSTTVDGERYEMNEGDLVLTPMWTFHDHDHRGDQPMIWLDVLDISLMRNMQATFFDPFEGQVQPVAAQADRSFRLWGSGTMRPPGRTPHAGVNPLLTYPRDRALQALDLAAGLPADPFDDVILEYQNPANGGPAMTTMAMTLQRLRPGFRGRARRHTGSKVYHAVAGSGTTIVAGQRFDWNRGDFLVVPPWAWHEHHNTSSGDALLFQVNDTPALAALGWYREQALEQGNGHQQVQEQK